LLPTNLFVSMASDNKLSSRCPIRTTLEMLGGKWRLILINQLKEGPMRFGELAAALPDISEKMLAQELKILAENNLVQRRDYEEVPPRVEYELTEAGREALPLIDALATFGIEYQKKLFGE
jgi:DNA-binding HxlR family transcriptional regulator